MNATANPTPAARPAEKARRAKPAAAPTPTAAPAASKPASTDPQAACKPRPPARAPAAPAGRKAGQPAKAEPLMDGGVTRANPPRPGSKRAKVVALLARPNGATSDEIKAAFAADGWTDRHVRECLAILRRQHSVPVVERDGDRFAIGKPGDPAPATKSAKAAGDKPGPRTVKPEGDKPTARTGP